MPASPDSDSLPDEQLVEQAQAGHREAFGELVRRHQDRLYNSLFRMLNSADEARDVCQEAFIQAWTRLSKFRGDAKFYSWLFRIAMNAAITRKRRERRAPTSLDAYESASGQEATDPRSDVAPSAPLESRENQLLVQKALAELAEEFREVLVLKEIEGLKYDEIADVLSLPIGTVRSRIHRGRMELRNRLERLLGDR